ncbi:hypothetical protein SBV1_gp05 [Sulfolobales Beppu virus 1]|nr:hypothetical protein SBV1_gp05 [Sulfolobales Beppu virus 1]
MIKVYSIAFGGVLFITAGDYAGDEEVRYFGFEGECNKKDNVYICSPGLIKSLYINDKPIQQFKKIIFTKGRELGYPLLLIPVFPIRFNDDGYGYLEYQFGFGKLYFMPYVGEIYISTDINQLMPK